MILKYCKNCNKTSEHLETIKENNGKYVKVVTCPKCGHKIEQVTDTLYFNNVN